MEINSPLGYVERTHLSVCIDGALGYDLDGEDVERARAALSGALANSPTTPPEEFEDWELVKGCPLEVQLSPEEAYRDNLYAQLTMGGPAPRLATDPSPHFVFIYFLPSDVWYGDSRVVRAGWKYIPGSAETACRMDLCWSLSHALFIPSDIDEKDFRDALIARLGLLADIITPDPTFDLEACERGTPSEISGCTEYLECKTPPLTSICQQRLEELGIDLGTPSR
jgi:hypothetical protein